MSASTATRRTVSPTRAAQKNAGTRRSETSRSTASSAPKRAKNTASSSAKAKKPAAPKAPAKTGNNGTKPAASRKPASRKAPAKPAASRATASANGKLPALLVGFDFGTNTCCIYSGTKSRRDASGKFVIPSVVGYADEGIVNGILPEDAHILFGEKALQHRLHLRLSAPLRDGIIGDLQASADYCQHIRELVDPERTHEVRAVIGLPANATDEAKEDLREAVTGAFERVLLIPEPFLAALGFRDEKKLGTAGYIDPVSNSVFIDIGAGTTDLCLVQGYFPTAEDQISLPYAGDKVDQLLYDAIRRTYPDTGISMHKVREIKEKHSHVGQPQEGHEVKLIVGGKPRRLEMGPLVNGACNKLADNIYKALTQLIGRIEPDGVEETLKNIILTGGGSRIGALPEWIENKLEQEGYESPNVRTVGDRYKEFVAYGGFKAAQSAREDQWQHLVR